MSSLLMSFRNLVCLCLMTLALSFSIVIQAQTTLQSTLTPTVVIDGILGTTHEVQYSTNLSDANGWKPLAVVRLDVTPKRFFDTTASGPHRFYRTVMIGVIDANLVWIPSGTFLMGSPTNESGRALFEGPQTPVTLTEGFFMGRHEVRMPELSAYVTGYVANVTGISDYTTKPANKVRWDQATNYCELRTAYERAQGMIPSDWAYRLPTAVEWEYACRAGTTTPFYLGQELRNDGVRSDAWFNGSFPYPTNVIPSGAFVPINVTNIGVFFPNAFGLQDMHGNETEWCLDTYPLIGALTFPQFAYLGTSVTNPTVARLGSYPSNMYGVVRGGGYGDTADGCRSAKRILRSYNNTVEDIGFRLVLSPTNAAVLQ